MRLGLIGCARGQRSQLKAPRSYSSARVAGGHGGPCQKCKIICGGAQSFGDRHKCVSLGLILFFMDSHIFVTVSSDASTAHVGGVKHEVLAGYFGF